MPNYLERVASSAGRRAAIARPPNSGPPVLPSGRDLSPATDDPFASDQDQFLESFEAPAPAPAPSAEIATPNLEVTEESRTTPTQAAKSVSSAVPKTRPLQERLSSESPLTVTLPRTLRPITSSKAPAPVPSEPPRERPPAPIVQSTTYVTEVKQSVITEADIAQPQPIVTEITEEQQPPAPRPIHTEIADTTPIPRVDRIEDHRDRRLQNLRHCRHRRFTCRQSRAATLDRNNRA